MGESNIENESYPILDAVIHYGIENLKKLIELGEDLNKAIDKDDSPLIRAISLHKWDKATLLVVSGADVNKGNPLSLLFNKIRINLKGEKFKLAQLMVEHGANIKATDVEGNTFLHLFFIYSYAQNDYLNYTINDDDVEKYIKWLIDEGVDVNKRNNSGMTSLEYAIISNCEQSACYLIDSGAKFLEPCAFQNFKEVYDIALQSFPLLRAVLMDREQIVRKMIEKGVDVNTVVNNATIVDYINSAQMYGVLNEYKDKFNDELYHLFLRQRLKFAL